MIRIRIEHNMHYQIALKPMNPLNAIVVVFRDAVRIYVKTVHGFIC